MDLFIQFVETHRIILWMLLALGLVTLLNAKVFLIAAAMAGRILL